MYGNIYRYRKKYTIFTNVPGDGVKFLNKFAVKKVNGS